MVVLNVIQAIIWLGIIPYLLGKFLTRKEDERTLYSWIIGNVIMMGLFMVISIPMILQKVDFKILRKSYLITVIVLTLISILVNRKKIFKIKKLKAISIFQIVAILLVVMQIFIKFEYSSVNNDDSSFVVLSNQMIDTGKMYFSSTNPNLESRRALAPISAYYAVISEYLSIHVTIVTHTIFPIIFVIWASLVYYYLGNSLFKNDKNLSAIFLIFMTLVNFYCFRFKGAGAYFLKFPWLGRVIVGGIFLPLLWTLLLEAMNKEKNYIRDWISILFLVLASCLCTEMAIALMAVSISIFALISSLRDKKISYLFKAVATIIPCLILAMVYINIK